LTIILTIYLEASTFYPHKYMGIEVVTMLRSSLFVRPFVLMKNQDLVWLPWVATTSQR